MTRVLVAWIGLADLGAAESDVAAGLGPVATAAKAHDYEEVVLLSSHPAPRTARYRAWLLEHTSAPVVVCAARLTGPTQLGEIYEAAVGALDAARVRHPRPSLVFHLSAGTPAMAAVWIILAKTRFPAQLIESSREHGVRDVAVPFDLYAEFLPELLRAPDAELEAVAAGAPPPTAELSALVAHSAVMKRLVERARRVALRRVPVLIEGESGTGKELLARAIHHSGPRRGQPFVAVNCGAIPAELVEAELFGHAKGAFTGAVAARLGHFREAHGGTLFLDELGELPAAAQVKLLRVLQAGEVVPVGASRPVAVDVRILCATHRNLVVDVASGRFRGDLFYRLAVAILVVPALRERKADFATLVDNLLEQVNRESALEPGYLPRRLTPGARQQLSTHSWPGNVRELLNTLRRAALWSSGAVLQPTDIRDAIVADATDGEAALLGRPLGEGFDLESLLGEVARHYLGRAVAETHGNRTQAAALLGLGSRQTLVNWMKRYGVPTTT